MLLSIYLYGNLIFKETMHMTKEEDILKQPLTDAESEDATS